MQYLHELAALFDPATVVLLVESGELPGWIDELAHELGQAKVRTWRLVLDDASATAGAGDTRDAGACRPAAISH